MKQVSTPRIAMLVVIGLVIVALLLPACSSSTPTPAATAPASAAAVATKAPAATTPQTAPAEAKEPAAVGSVVELKAVTFLPVNDERVKLFQDLLKSIEKKSNGTITTKFLGGQEVVPGAQVAQNLKAGNVDIAQIGAGLLEGSAPGVSIIAASQLTADEERKAGLWTKLNEMGAPGGIRFIGRFMPQNDPSFYMGFGKKKPAKLAELSGLKAGFTSATMKDFVQSIGMALVTAPLTEAYTAVEKGTVDAWISPINDLTNIKLYEVESAILDHPFLVTQGVFGMSLNTWNKLTPTMQQAITDAYLEWEPGSIKAQRDTEAKMKQDLMSKKNLEFIKWSPDDTAKFLKASIDAEWARFPKDKQELAQQLKTILNKK